ncbi:MAG: hypothetical protein QOH60_4326 [Mycobacterium sp.]|nr:hypothetical protein [Mycobacterium sp.]
MIPVCALLLALCACTFTVAGTVVTPQGPNPRADVVLADDGFGFRLGKPLAREEIALYIEPQCPHCANLLLEFGDEIERDIKDGCLAVTYRPLTFLDKGANTYSAQVSNALFLAAQPRAEVSAVQLQQYINNLYAAINPQGGNAWIADIARNSQLPSPLAARIEAGETALDTAAMYSVNKALLKDQLDSNPYTPAVYDLNARAEVEITPDWLATLVGQRPCIAAV